MERLMVVTTFQKSIETLKITDCSQKEKLALFGQITECLQSPTLRANVNYLDYLSSAISILLLFCEEMDSVVRISAEENLNKAIRFSIPTNIVRIQYDLFQEIKRNGNDRSLRIALNLFAHYAHLIKQRKIKPYALNLLPCILSISHRKEQQLIETLCNFIKNFCKYFQISLTVNEVSNLIEIFVKDAIMAECSVKRRCSATNVMSLIEYSKRPEVMSEHALNICLEIFVKDSIPSNLIGTFGLLRILLPKVISQDDLDMSYVHKVIEVIEICLHLLNDNSHTIINASLECLSVILSNSNAKLNSFLFGESLNHIEILCKKRSLKNQFFRHNPSKTSCETFTSNFLSSSTPDKHSKLNVSTKDNLNVFNSGESPNHKINEIIDDKALLTCSDIELDSIRINESESEKNFDSPLMQSPARMVISKSEPDTPLSKSHKTGDSFGSFFNTILTHSSTESVSKFFRGNAINLQSDQSPKQTSTSRNEDETTDQNPKELDNISMLSMGSLMSLNSQNSSALGTFDFLSKTDDTAPDIQEVAIFDSADIAPLETQMDEIQSEQQEMEKTQDLLVNPSINANILDNEKIFIGAIDDQPLIHFIVRSISSKFLLSGEPDNLIDDCTVRISIKNLSLIVIGHCIKICPEVMLISMQMGANDRKPILTQTHLAASDSEDSECSNTEKVVILSENKNLDNALGDDIGEELNIKDDHFGEDSKIPSSYFDFSFPLSKSADNVLLSRLTNNSDKADKIAKTLSNKLTDLLSKSEIIDSKHEFAYNDAFPCIIQPGPSNKNHIGSKTKLTEFKPEWQRIEDILLFWNHSDPILRSNIQTIAGHFLFKILNESSSIQNCFQKNRAFVKCRFVHLDILIHILLRGLFDNIHTVVKQSLVSLEGILLCLLGDQLCWVSKLNRSLQCESEAVNKQKLSIEFEDIDFPIQLLEKILQEVLLVNDNKYWLVKNKYCQLIATINFESLYAIVGPDQGQLYKDQYIAHVYTMLKDEDPRIRNEAIKTICDLAIRHAPKLSQYKYSSANHLANEFMLRIASIEIPYLLDNQRNWYLNGIENNDQSRKKLGMNLFNLTNMLFEMQSKEQLLGVTKCLVTLMTPFDPVSFIDTWSEFNILEVSMSLLNSNYLTGTDLVCQCDTITICAYLLAAKVLNQLGGNEQKEKESVNSLISPLLIHIMKIFNIYQHILTNKRPLFIPKGQKPDIFANSKEIQMLNRFGYFGNDYFYLKIHKTLRSIHENYKITINREIDQKMFSLLEVCLKSMAILLEVTPFHEYEDRSSLLIDELLGYLKTFISFVPKKSVICLEQLLKFMYSINIASRENQFRFVAFQHLCEMETSELFNYLQRLRSPPLLLAKVLNNPTATGSKLINFLASTSSADKAKISAEDKGIKIFEPLVIHCLKLFTKSDSNVQSVILNLICRVLYLRVNYCLLDANNIFIEFIMKLLDSIEIGYIRDSYILTPKIVAFLSNLAKQEDSPQMTIPKIINITDTLLANSLTKNGSIEALCQLAYEINFNKSINIDIPKERSVALLNEKESNTQKEVVFSMLLKFIGEPMVKKTICMILLKETTAENLKSIRNELIDYFLHSFSDKKSLINDYNDFVAVRQMIVHVFSNLERNQKLKFLQRLMHNECSLIFDDLAVKTILCECFLKNDTENDVIDLLKEIGNLDTPPIECLANNLRISLFKFVSIVGIDTKIFCKTDIFVDYLSLLQKFVDLVKSLLSKWHCLGIAFKKNSTENAKLIETSFRSMQELPKSSHSVHIVDQDILRAKKYDLSSILFTLFGELQSESQSLLLLDVLKEIELNSIYDWNSYDRCMRRGFLHTIISLRLTANDIDFLLRKYFEELLFTGKDFILKAALDEKHYEFILGNLFSFFDTNESQRLCASIILDINEEIDDKCIDLSVENLLNLIFKCEELQCIDSWIGRRSFELLGKKLRHIATDTIIPYLKRFENHFKNNLLYPLVESPLKSLLQINDPIHEYNNLSKIINDDWFTEKAKESIHRPGMDKRNIYLILSEIKSETKIRNIFESNPEIYDKNFIPTLIECSFENMLIQFKQGCFQHNAHMNYLKVSNVLKQSMNMLNAKMEDIYIKLYSNDDKNVERTFESHKIMLPNSIEMDFELCVVGTQAFLKGIMHLYSECLIYLEAGAFKKFTNENFFGTLTFERLTHFAFICLNFVEQFDYSNQIEYSDLYAVCDCLFRIQIIQLWFNENNNHFTSNESYSFFYGLLNGCYSMVDRHLASKLFIQNNNLNIIMEKLKRSNDATNEAALQYAKAIYLAKFIDCIMSDISEGGPSIFRSDICNVTAVKDILVPMMIEMLRTEFFYFFAVTPYEIIQTFEWYSDLQTSNKLNHLPSIPIEYLNEADNVEKFVRRINIFGFPSRPYFEEIFMSLLLLINQENDSNVVDAQEEFQIKGMCLTAVIEMILSTKMFPQVGDRFNGIFHHNPRLPRPKVDTISIKKLHNIQNMTSGLNHPTIFYMPNLERPIAKNTTDNLIGTNKFLSQQFELNIIWHIIEGEQFASKALNIELKNMNHFLTKSGIDINSSIQLTFDVITQLIEIDCVHTLAQVAKFVEICSSRDQFHWIKDTMSQLSESIPAENVDAHQHIIYCLCKSHAVLIPSIQDLNHLCNSLAGYLRSYHLIIRNAALKGLLLLFESCIKTNTTIGSLSEEILLLRGFIINYVSKYGIINESPFTFSNEHTMLVWTLNFYVIETTSKFLPECNLVADTIISANNILKRTTNFEQFTCIVNGLERIIIAKSIEKPLLEKIEKLSLELIKSGNEIFSLVALRLLTTCMYIDSNDQLENTERCNGIIQEDPDIIVQSTEVIDILFHQIKMSTHEAANIYGNVLCQIARDLIPPKELLTRVMKELLTISQPHCQVIAKILFQVFRSAIDSTYFPMLQDWLLCSLPNFLTFHIQKVLWYLTVIFISVSINFDLIKIFPQLLAEYNSVVDVVIHDREMQKLTNEKSKTSENVYNITLNPKSNQMSLFILASGDFYQRLNVEQQLIFRNTFTNLNDTEIKEMLNAL